MVYLLAQSIYMCKIFDVKTETTAIISRKQLMKLLEVSTLLNGSIEGDKIITSKWHKKKNYIAIGRLDEERYLIADLYSYSDTKLVAITNRELNMLIQHKDIVNCTYKRDGGYKLIDTTTKVRVKDEFKRKVEKEINEFKTKCVLMGVNIDMEYIIMGNDVILTEYKSSNKNLLLPKCITSLGDNSVEVDKNTKIHSHIRYIGG